MANEVIKVQDKFNLLLNKSYSDSNKYNNHLKHSTKILDIQALRRGREKDIYYITNIIHTLCISY